VPDSKIKAMAISESAANPAIATDKYTEENQSLVNQMVYKASCFEGPFIYRQLPDLQKYFQKNLRN